ncbi:MAG: hypothetical protein H6619_02925 [Deltaproteobacteria bacterium]|nr:hypothetical protein [Deltaproteobacteria bacterium]
MFSNERGAYTIGAAISFVFISTIIFSAFDFISISRYSSAAQWVAMTAARVSIAERPNDKTGSAPVLGLLKLPVSSQDDSYLMSYCGGRMQAQKRRVINLALGEAQRVFGNKVKTAVNWDLNTESIKEGEVVIVPRECSDPGSTVRENAANCQSSDACSQWQVCVRPPSIFLHSHTVCHTASSEMNVI